MGVASIDGAIRRAHASGGVSSLIDELSLVAISAGLSNAPADTEPPPSPTTMKEGDSDEYVDSGLEIRLPCPSGGKQHARGTRVLVEDVTEKRRQEQEERCAAVARAEFFTLRRFLPFAHKLVTVIGSEWLPLMSDVQRQACFDVFFLCDNEEAALASILALGSAFSNSHDDYAARHMVSLTSTWISRGGLDKLLRFRSNTFAGSCASAEHFADAMQVLVSMPDRVANRLQGRVPPEFQPSVYFSKMVADALSAVKSDATRAFRDAEDNNAQQSGVPQWVRHWLGDSGCLPASQSPSTHLQDVGGRWSSEEEEAARQRRSAGLCAAVGELLGKISLAGKARVVAAALLSLASQLPSPSEATAGSGEAGMRMRRRGEAVAEYLSAAAHEERAAVERALTSTKRALGSFVGQKVLGFVPAKAIECVFAALLDAQGVCGPEGVRGCRAGGGVRVSDVGLEVVGQVAVSTELVALAAHVVHERGDVEVILWDRFLTERTLREHSIANFSSLLLACDVLSSRETARPPETRAMTVAARRLGAVLADERFVQGGAELQQRHCLGLLVRCLLHLGHARLEESGVIPSILEAVSVRLHCPTAKARKRAMLLAQVFAFVMDPANPLEFDDFESDDDEVATRSEAGTRETDAAPALVAPVYGPQLPGQGEGAGTARGDGVVGGGGSGGEVRAERKGGAGGCRAVGQGAMGRTGKERKERGPQRFVRDDPDKVMVSSESEEEEEEEEEEEGESESDDGLVAYELDDDDEESEEEVWGTDAAVAPVSGNRGSDDDDGPVRIGKGRVALPTNLRQCLLGLKSSNADEVEAAVFALPPLAERSAALSGEVCCEVAVTLLRLEDRIAMHDFAGRRRRGLLALACADPQPVAARFSECVWNTNEALSVRMDALEILADTAIALSALPDTAPPPPPPPVSSSVCSVASGDPSLAPAPYDIYDLASGKTRRWSDSCKVRRAAVGVNEFGELLLVFFFALAQGLHDPSAVNRLLGIDFVLLGRIVATLGVYIDCGSHSPATRVAANSLVPILRHPSLRHHQQAYVRRCVLFALTRVLLTLPSHIVVADFGDVLPDLREWMRAASGEDGDTEVVRLAMAAGALLSQHSAASLPSISVLAEW